LKKKFNRIVVIAPTRSTCLNISMVLDNGAIPQTLLMQEKGKEIFEAVEELNAAGFGVVAGTGTGKTVSLRDIAKAVLLKEELRVDVVTREHEATEYTWTCNVLVITPGVALHWLKSQIITKDDLIVIDEIHQTSEHLELSMALAKRAGCKFVWMSATIDPKIYSEYLEAGTVVECSAFDPSKRSEVECLWKTPEEFLSSEVSNFIEEERAVAVFVPTREMAEKLSREYGSREGLYCDFYHGGEKAEKLRQFLRGDVPKPFMVFMTIAGASSLNILGLDTVVIVDEMYKEIVRSGGVRVLEKVRLGNNELLQMGGRVNGRMENSKIYILGSRSIDFHSLKPTAPEFVLGGDLRQVALACARLGVNASELDLIASIDLNRYETELTRFKARGIIGAEGNELTAYGKKVERLPVEPSWAELIVQSRDSGNWELLDTVVVSGCAESLYSLLRKDANLSEVKVSGSDNLTAYNVVVYALNQFGYLRKSKSNGEGVEYGFQGDWFRKKHNKKTGQTEKNMGGFVQWCDDNGFNPKAIKEVAIAMKSVYRQLRIRMPGPQDLQIVSENDEMHKKFVDLLARVQSLDFVHDKQNSQVGTVWRAKHSLASGARVLGKIRHWTDRRGSRRATIEGTEVPEDLFKLYADKKPVSVERITDEGVEIEFKSSFAGESIGSIVELVDDSEIPVKFVEQAERKFIEALLYQRISAEFADQNRKTREQSRQLRVRSGGAVEEISESDEQKLYEAEFADKGIISAQSLKSAIESGKVNPDNLLLKLEDFISAEEQKKIMADNPDTVTVEGETLTVEYGVVSGSEFYCRAEVAEEFARSAKTEAVTLPGRRIVELCCGGYATKSFPELVKKLEQRRIEQAWSEKRSELESSSWISDPEKVFQLLPKILTAVEITREDNEQGESILGFFSLKSDSDLDFKIKIRESEEEAREETKTGLERLLRKATREFRRIPSEEPWDNSELREALKNRLDALLEEHYENLTPENFMGQIELIKAEIETVKAEIGGKHAETQQLVEKTEAKVNAKVEAIKSEFVESEISQARKEIQKAKDYLKSAAYEEAKAACEMAVELADRLAELTETRSTAKREAEAAREEVSDDLYDLEKGYEDFIDATSDERAEAEQISEGISDAFSGRRYEAVIEKVEEVRELIAQVRERHTRIEALLKSEYAVCPVCNGELYRDDAHYCNDDGQLALRVSGGGEDGPVKISRIGDQELILLIVEYNSDYDEFRMMLKVNSQILAENPSREIETETLWREPSAAERKIISEIAELEQKLSWIEDERSRGGRVEVTFSEKQGPKRKVQLQGEGIFTGGVENRKADGWSEYENQPAIFVCRDHCPWLDEPPASGQTWICTLGFQIAMKGGKPVIVVNPQARSDEESEIREEIAGLERELSALQAAVGTEDQKEEEDKISSSDSDAANLVAAMNKMWK
jgi:hypothetical protein